MELLGAKEFFIGSNTEKIIRTANFPVLTIKHDMSGFDPKNIFFASNFSKESIEAFKSLAQVLSLFAPKVHWLKVITPASFETTDFAERLMSDFFCRIQEPRTALPAFETIPWLMMGFMSLLTE